MELFRLSSHVQCWHRSGRRGRQMGRLLNNWHHSQQTARASDSGSRWSSGWTREDSWTQSVEEGNNVQLNNDHKLLILSIIALIDKNWLINGILVHFLSWYTCTIHIKKLTALDIPKSPTITGADFILKNVCSQLVQIYIFSQLSRPCCQCNFNSHWNGSRRMVTCARILILSRGAVADRETIPATPPARMAFHNTREEGGRGGGARSAPA